MKTKEEVKDAIINQKKMVWNDPEPIDGNDYTVQKIWNINEETAMIQYGEDNSEYLSEAEVHLSELTLKIKTKEEVTKEQIDLQNQIQQEGFNIVSCGNCGTVLIHKTDKESIDCICGEEMDLWDCPDLWI